MANTNLSIAIIAKNEADRIGRLIKSVEFVNEVLVVDSGSIDGTQEVCKKLGAKVVFHEWAGYAGQKQFAMDCTTSWKGEGLHEKLIVNGKIKQFSEPILHYVYRNISDHVVTINRFSDIYAAEHGPSGWWFVPAGAVHALGKFAECYLWKLGFLDGIPGLVIAMNSAWYVFLKHAKAWEAGLQVPKLPKVC
jgi:hypothetical protein